MLRCISFSLFDEKGETVFLWVQRFFCVMVFGLGIYVSAAWKLGLIPVVLAALLLLKANQGAGVPNAKRASESEMVFRLCARLSFDLRSANPTAGITESSINAVSTRHSTCFDFISLFPLSDLLTNLDEIIFHFKV